jgi:hypothetical protein
VVKRANMVIDERGWVDERGVRWRCCRDERDRAGAG